jgi:hypothetical protein
MQSALARRTIIGAFLVGVLLASLAPQALAATKPTTHYWVNACKLAREPGLRYRAGHALRDHIRWERSMHVAGFSECLFVSKPGRFVLLDLASTYMLSHHAGHKVTAEQEFSKIDAVGGFPAALQYINKKRTQFLNSHVWDIGLRGDVLGVATFGFFHKVNKRVPTFPDARARLYIFLNTRVMPKL